MFTVDGSQPSLPIGSNVLILVFPLPIFMCFRVYMHIPSHLDIFIYGERERKLFSAHRSFGNFLCRNNGLV